MVHVSREWRKWKRNATKYITDIFGNREHRSGGITGIRETILGCRTIWAVSEHSRGSQCERTLSQW